MDEQYIEDARKAGKLAALALQHGAKLIKPGASYKDTYKSIVQFITDNGGFPAFPPQMSFNETAAHFLVGLDKDITFKDELIKLDVGVAVNGVIGDNALTIDLSGKHQALVDTARACVNKVKDNIKLDMTLNQIGTLIEDEALKNSLMPVRNLSGHGLGKFQIHTAPTIPNFASGDTKTIQPGMHFACEPFVTTGQGMIHDKGVAEIFSLVNEKPTRDPTARKVLTFIKQKYDTLPFGTIDLEELKIPLFKLKVGLRRLVQEKILEQYPPLVEVENGMVAQAEHTFLVLPDGTIECTTFLE